MNEFELVFDQWAKLAREEDYAALDILHNDEVSFEDAFYRDLAFGTGGLRGKLGMGPNRMNVYTVGKATQGLADYLNEHFEDPSVALCRDSRHGGEEFVRCAAEVLAANDIRALLYPRIEPTPALSFAVRDLGCSAGINITASHNPAEYNGYKVYGPDGCQITVEAAHEIQAAIDATDIFEGVKRIPFDEGLESGLISHIGEDTLDRYCDAVLGQSTGADCSGLSVVYTPLNGTGLECVSRILERIGVTDVSVVPEQAEPDGDFPTCPYPNPEIREALSKGLDLCESVKPDLLLANDPDADRVGIAVPHDGGYTLLSGNEVGLLLLDFMARRAEAAGKDMSREVAMTTIVSAPMADDLACEHGFELRRTLTGFKFIGEQVGLLERRGREGDFLFGFEESYGYLTGSYVRDKDAVVASMLICEMASAYRAEGLGLYEAMERLYGRYGYWGNNLLSVKYEGPEGADKMAAIMAGLRREGLAEVAGLAVESFTDYSTSAPMPVVNPLPGEEPQTLPASDVLEFRLASGSRVLIRPSGTEPKIKAYVFGKGATREEADAVTASLSDAMMGIIG